jgi:hypothetical protein
LGFALILWEGGEQNFVTLATPHLGNRRPPRGSVNRLYNAIAPRLFDRTGQQFALLDDASAETLALSQRVERKYPERVSHAGTVLLYFFFMDSPHHTDRLCAAFQDMDGVLPTSLEDKEPSVYRCELRDRVLSIYSLVEPETETSLLRVDLTRADVTILLPDTPAKDSTTEGDWSIRIQPEDGAGPSCTLHLPGSDLASCWQWVPAVSNASLAIRCCTQSSQSLPPPRWQPLLSCLTRGQFLHALQLFRVRTLYATVFNDHTVPYSCAAVRAFNPFRHTSSTDTKPLQTSPLYDHILAHSLANTPLLRDTRESHQRTKSQSLPPQPSSNQDEGLEGARPPPFAEGRVLLDRVDAAFTQDDARDMLRAMLIAVQSVGWRRVDVRLDSLMAHEMVIAKRSDITAEQRGPLDILHHLMDTFEL